jgi:D-ribose pyranase
MKKMPLLHPEISLAIAKLGRGDRLVITEAGFGIPDDVKRIDLALTRGIPTINDTLRVILTELDVEEVILAEEMQEVSPKVYAEMNEILGDIPTLEILNAAFKQQVKMARVVIRTGEISAYANMILRAGRAGSNG